MTTSPFDWIITKENNTECMQAIHVYLIVYNYYVILRLDMLFISTFTDVCDTGKSP